MWHPTTRRLLDVLLAMQRHPLIDDETKIGRDDNAICRRLYSLEIPFVFEKNRDKYFNIMEEASSELDVAITDLKVAGSAQTGFSFHENRPFQRKTSDLDLAVINAGLFEKMLRSAQEIALPNPESAERPRQSVFPTRNGRSLYSNFAENVALYGMILPWQMPDCNMKSTILVLSSKLSQKNLSDFKEVNFAFYMSHHFFYKKTAP